MSFLSLLSDYTIQIVVTGTLILGLVSGALGSFAMLRKQSLLGDAISHAALPGVCIAFILTLSKMPFILLLGAGISGWIGTLLMLLITEYTALKRDTALGIILSVFFGFGLVLLTFIQRLPTANQSGLNKFLFGSASTLLYQDVVIMGWIGGLTLLILVLFWKEFKLVSFDPEFSNTLGFSSQKLSILLTTLMVMAIIIGLQTVGVVLMSAMIIAPAAAARQWTDRLSVMVILSAFFGALSGTVGSLLSSVLYHMPTGPTIVLVMSSIVLLSLFFSPHRGLVWNGIERYYERRRMRGDTLLVNFLMFSESKANPMVSHDITPLRALGRAGVEKTLKRLEQEGLIQSSSDTHWGLTEEGVRKAHALQKEMS